jgi:short-subunit dehydrogenase
MSNKGTALITGASTGIGAVYADRLAKRGYDLILVARSKDKLDEVAAQIQSKTGRKTKTVQADLSIAADIKRIADLLDSDDSITAFVNNAGVGAAAPVLTTDASVHDQIIQINIKAFTHLALAAAASFAKRSNGLIINIGSVVGLAPEQLNGVYSASKAYVQNLSIALNKELADTGVSIQLVLPGATATPTWEKSGVSIAHLPTEIVMATDDMVDASLAGLDQGEFVTIPSLPDPADYETFEKARLALAPNLSRNTPAERYGVGEKK